MENYLLMLQSLEIRNVIGFQINFDICKEEVGPW